MKSPHLLAPLISCCLLAGSALASDPYRYPPESVYPPQFTYGYTYETHEHHCGNLQLPGWKWSDWYFVECEDGVELQVRYRMRNIGARGTRTFMQLRYVNRSKCIKTATVARLRLHFHDGTPDLIWNGEQVTMEPYSVGYGRIQTLDGRLCTWTKCYDVR
ncbi:MAG: hypothetical protein DVB23_002238 [Verrucomicrobia bacterium]|nr:MAG: hypothetical protein DVB23_002238 [Verrucomicrobiota bacterium]